MSEAWPAKWDEADERKAKECAEWLHEHYLFRKHIGTDPISGVPARDKRPEDLIVEVFLAEASGSDFSMLHEWLRNEPVTGRTLGEVLDGLSERWMAINRKLGPLSPEAKAEARLAVNDILGESDDL